MPAIAQLNGSANKEDTSGGAVTNALQKAALPPPLSRSAITDGDSHMSGNLTTTPAASCDDARHGGAPSGIRVLAYNPPAASAASPSTSVNSVSDEPQPRPSWEVRLAALRSRRSSASLDRSPMQGDKSAVTASSATTAAAANASPPEERDGDDVVRCSGEVRRTRRPARSGDYSASPFSSVLSSPTSSGDCNSDGGSGCHSQQRDFSLVTPATSSSFSVTMVGKGGPHSTGVEAMVAVPLHCSTDDAASAPIPFLAALPPRVPNTSGTSPPPPITSPSPPASVVSAVSASSRQPQAPVPAATATAATGSTPLPATAERPSPAAAAATVRPALRRLASNISAASTATFAEAPIAERSFGAFSWRDSPPSRPIRAAPMQTDSDSCDDDDGEEEEEDVYAAERVHVEWHVETPSAESVASDTEDAGSAMAVVGAAAAAAAAATATANGLSVPDLAERFLEHIVGLQKSAAGASRGPAAEENGGSPSAVVPSSLPQPTGDASGAKNAAPHVQQRESLPDATAAAGPRRRHPLDKVAAASHRGSTRPKAHSACPQMESEDVNSLSNSALTTATLSSMSCAESERDGVKDERVAVNAEPPTDSASSGSVAVEKTHLAEGTVSSQLRNASAAKSAPQNGSRLSPAAAALSTAPRERVGDVDAPLREAYPARSRTATVAAAGVDHTKPLEPTVRGTQSGAAPVVDRRTSSAAAPRPRQQKAMTNAIGTTRTPATTKPSPTVVDCSNVEQGTRAVQSVNATDNLAPQAQPIRAPPPSSAPAQQRNSVQRAATKQPTTTAAAASPPLTSPPATEKAARTQPAAAPLASSPLTQISKPPAPQPVYAAAPAAPASALPPPRLSQKPQGMRPLLSQLVAAAMADYTAQAGGAASPTTAASSTADLTPSTSRTRPAATTAAPPAAVAAAAVVAPYFSATTAANGASASEPTSPASTRPRPRAPSPGSSPEAKESATRSSPSQSPPLSHQLPRHIDASRPDWHDSLVAGVRLHRDSPHTRRPRLSSRERSPSGRVTAAWNTTSPGAWDGQWRSVSAEREASLLAGVSASSSTVAYASLRRPGGPGGERSASTRGAPPAAVTRPLLSTAVYPAFHATTVGAGYKLTDSHRAAADDVPVIREELELQAHLQRLKTESMRRRAERYC